MSKFNKTTLALAMGAMDSDNALYYAEELEVVKARAFEVEYDDIMFRSIIPVDNEGSMGTQSIITRVYDRVGMAKVIAGYSDDLPRADVFGAEQSVSVRTIGASYGYNVIEIAAARQAGMPLEQRRANAAMMAVEEKLNEIAFNGEAEAGLGGMLSNPNIPTGNVVNGASGGTEWTTKTPDEILFDVNDLFADIRESTRGRERPSRLLLPLSKYNYIVSAPRSANSDKTILGYIVENSPYLRSMDDVIALNELETAGTAGSAVMLAYNPDPSKLAMHIPYEANFLPETREHLHFETPVIARTAGVQVYYPLSLRVKEGI